MIAWMLYTIAISAALGLAALAVERALGLYHRPTRWAWVAAMAGSLAIPTALLVIPRAASTGAADVAPPAAIEAPLVGPIADRIPAASASGWPDLAPWLLAGWAMVSLVLLVFFARSAWRLRRARRRWRSVEIAGQPVLESDSIGPAVIGVVRTRVAVPGWVRDLDDDLQALVLAHERSHQAASDPLLLGLGVAACVAVPWCAPLWWQLRRLRLAIEVDCDRRVLAGGASLARYGSLLLEVGRRSGGRPFALVGLFEPRSFLERRIRVMTSAPPRHRLVLALVLTAVTVPVFGIAATLSPPEPLRVNAPSSPEEVPTQDSSEIRHYVVWVPDRHGDDVTIEELGKITEMKPSHPLTWRRILDRVSVPAGGGCGLDRSNVDPAIRRVEDTGSDEYGFTVPVVCYLIEAEIGPDTPKIQPEMPITLAVQSRFRNVDTIEDLYAAGYTNEVSDYSNMVVYHKELLDERDEIGCGMRMDGEVRVFTLEIGERPTGPNFLPWDPDAPPSVCLYLIPKEWDRSTVRFERRERPRPESEDEMGATIDAPEMAETAVDTPPRFSFTPFTERPTCIENCDSDAILAALENAGVAEARCDAVIGIRIGLEGTVTGTDALESDETCDAALRDWAESTRWTPAHNRGEPVAVWIAQPVRLYPEPESEDARERMGPVHVEAETDPDAMAKTALRRAMTAQEWYRAENGEYADAFELDLSPPETITLEVRSDGEGYVMVARHDHGTTPFCASSSTLAVQEGSDC